MGENVKDNWIIWLEYKIISTWLFKYLIFFLLFLIRTKKNNYTIRLFKYCYLKIELHLFSIIRKENNDISEILNFKVEVNLIHHYLGKDKYFFFF